MIFGETPLDQAEAAILAHSLRRGTINFKKGRVLSAEDVTRLAAAGVERVVAARLELGDVHEDEAAGALAAGHDGKAVLGPRTAAPRPPRQQPCCAVRGGGHAEGQRHFH